MSDELPLYECHKRVRAARIVESVQVDSDGGFMLTLELPNNITRQQHYYKPPGRQANATSFVGGYLVIYADGYESWSPAKAFEEGYQLASLRVEVELRTSEGDVKVTWPASAHPQTVKLVLAEVLRWNITRPFTTPKCMEGAPSAVDIFDYTHKRVAHEAATPNEVA